MQICKKISKKLNNTCLRKCKRSNVSFWKIFFERKWKENKFWNKTEMNWGCVTKNKQENCQTSLSQKCSVFQLVPLILIWEIIEGCAIYRSLINFNRISMRQSVCKTLNNLHEYQKKIDTSTILILKSANLWYKSCQHRQTLPIVCHSRWYLSRDESKTWVSKWIR